MDLAIGTRIGPYEIRGLLGRGGMGSVYRAADATLGREVAIKALPSGLSSDSDRLARFEREARLLASLNHPHIATLHGVERSSGLPLLVMELVPGETLADRIARGPIPVPEALSLMSQVAEALDAAHERGVVHRDLKPANVKVTPEGRVKVLDFGLAKAVDANGGSPDDSQLPTLTSAGTIVGTTAYMSPEQARGLPVDRRTDVWSFGCVLFEALAGRRPFPGGTVSDTIAAILEREPDWAALPATTPASVRRLLRRCLDKDLRRRLRYLDPAQLVADDPSGVLPAFPAARPRRWMAPVLGLAGCAAAFTFGLAFARREAPQPPAWVRQPIVLAIHPPEGVTLADAGPLVSPDGSRVVFSATSKGSTQLWVRPLDQEQATPLAGTTGALQPFWSADGRSLAFFAEGKLRRVDLASGTVHSLVDAGRVSPGGDWSRDGVILYSTRAQLMRISAAGGPATPVARLDASHFEDSLRYPHFLPDGQHYLYVARSGRPEESAAYVGALDGTTRRLSPVQSKVAYASGHLVFVREGALLAQPFDLSSLATRGEAIPIVRSVEQRANSLLAFFSVSPNGVLAYRAGARSRNELRWLDRGGRTLGSLGGPEAKPVLNVRLSPAGDRLAFDEFDNRTGVRAVWIADVRAGTRTRLTFSGSDWAPVWSPDGQEIVFRSHREGSPNLYRRRADGSGADEPMLPPGEERSPMDWSSDGRVVIYQGAARLFALRLTGDREPVAVPVGGNVVDPRFSPDGGYVAYASDESGQLEVYVQPFPATGAKWQVSSAGGTHPRWRGDGRELFFVDRGQTLVSVAIDPGTPFRAGAARALFKVDGTAMGGGANKYDVTRDGQRFLVISAFDPPAADPIFVVLNWTALLPR